MDLDLFIVCQCTKDSSGFVRFVNIGWIFWKSVYESNPWTKYFENIKVRDTWYKTNQDLYCKAGIEPFLVRICDHETIRIHVFTNLLYDNRNLTKYTFPRFDLDTCFQITSSLDSFPIKIWFFNYPFCGFVLGKSNNAWFVSLWFRFCSYDPHVFYLSIDFKHS